MLQLTQHQSSVGSVLQEGAQLLKDQRLMQEDEAQIHSQMALLNSRWEELRVTAMERQSKLVPFIQSAEVIESSMSIAPI